MAGSVNRVILVGNVCQDPEIRSLNNGERAANFSLATNETWKDKNSGERKEKAEFHRVCVFNDRIADVVEKYVCKGSKLYVEGSLQTRKWTDNSGADRYSTEVVISKFRGELTMLDSRRDESGGAARGQPRESSAAREVPGREGAHKVIPADLDDEIPF